MQCVGGIAGFRPPNCPSGQGNANNQELTAPITINRCRRLGMPRHSAGLPTPASPFSAFWLRSCVVSVLISLIADTWFIEPLSIRSIFLGGFPAVQGFGEAHKHIPITSPKLKPLPPTTLALNTGCTHEEPAFTICINSARQQPKLAQQPSRNVHLFSHK